jgi:hypothetical protein
MIAGPIIEHAVEFLIAPRATTRLQTASLF